MPAFLARLMASQRGRQLVGFATIAIGIIALVGLVMALQRCSIDEQVEQGVTLDRAEVSRDAYEKGLAAERAATANQIEAERAFRNSQEEADDAIDDAARRRSSPLDDLFNRMR